MRIKSEQYIYLCGAINGCTDYEANNWRDVVKEKYPYCINPMRRDYRGKELTNYREIVELDKRDIDLSNLVLVNYSIPSVGTSMEMLYAWEHNKPIILWSHPEKELSPWLIYHSTIICHSIDNVLESINKILD